MSTILPSTPLATAAELAALTNRVASGEIATAAALKVLTDHLALDDVALAKLAAALTPAPVVIPPIILPPYDPQVIWRAGMETGNMTEWYAAGGGGEYNGNPGELPGTGLVPSDVANSRSEASQEQAHGGLWSAKLSIPGAWGAVRLKRWLEAASHRELYYTAWFYVPQVYTVDQAAGGSTNWWQTKSVTATQNDPFFLIGWFNPAPGVMRQQLVWWGPATEGPAAAQTGWRAWYSPIDVPIGRWFKHEVRLINAGDFTGAIQAWQDGVEIFHLENVKTRYPTGTLEWGLANYCSNITPSPCYFYVDDVTISLARMP